VQVLDWGKLPDLAAVALLACAFLSVARRSKMAESGIWLTAWIMIALHFASSILAPLPGFAGNFAGFISLGALVWAGLLFMFALVPYRAEQRSVPWMGVALTLANTVYCAIITFAPSSRALIPAALLFSAAPLAVTLYSLRKFNHPLRWSVVGLYSALAVFLLMVQFRPGDGTSLALNAVLFCVYFGCCIHCWAFYRRTTTGTFITVAGFFAWASVFVVGPTLMAMLPTLQIESEVWNLPKYVVAVGMILLLLEEQIEHNKYLALHDELTGLPNRRLFQDRLESSLERARRTGEHAALLLIDLDHFKRVNDTLGHHVGDMLLQHVGMILSGRARRSDTVARTGGDEFSVILEEPTSREEAQGVGHSLIQLLNEPLTISGHSLRVGASIGIAVFPDDATTMESLCIAADLRMYAKKHSERDRGRVGETGSVVPVPFSRIEAKAGIPIAK